MNDYESLSHSVWDCKYHVVWIPKFRKKVLYGQLREHMGEILRELARQKESRVVEGHLIPDHIHMLISIPPKYAVASVVGFIKGKSAIHLARSFMGRRKNYEVKTFGHVATSFQPSVWMKLLSVSTSKSKSRKIVGWINSSWYSGCRL